jgi:hypothetical protein
VSKDIVTQAEENLAKRKEELLVQYAEQVLARIQGEEDTIALAQNRIEENKDQLDKIVRGDEEFIRKVLQNMAFGNTAGEVYMPSLAGIPRRLV